MSILSILQIAANYEIGARVLRWSDEIRNLDKKLNVNSHTDFST